MQRYSSLGKGFVDAGKFFIEHERYAEQIFHDISLVLSKENMLELAKALKHEDGYSIKNKLLDKLIELMLAIRKRCLFFYHKDTNQFNYWSFSETEREKLNENALLPSRNLNSFILPICEEINHKEIMRFYVREFVEEKTIWKG